MKQIPALPSTLALLCAAALAGCASSVKLDETPVESRTPTPVAAGGVSATPGARAGGTPQSQVATVDLTKPAAATSASTLARIVYFDFDSFVIKDEFKPLIEGHAKVMSTSKVKRAVVEGHADERGSREYNLALGQKRAEAVVKSLALLGVGQQQVEAVSYGEERPAAAGHDEASWAKNRRAELKDR